MQMVCVSASSLSLMGIKNKQKTEGKFAAYASGGATRRWAIEV